MRGFRIEFVKPRRRPATWVMLAVSAGFFAWSWNHFEESSEAARLAAAVLAKPAAVDDSREAQELADARSRTRALDYPWPAILIELEAFADQNTSVLRFEHARSDENTRITVRTKDFTSLERALARVRSVAPAGHQWRIVSTTRDATDASYPLLAELIATKAATTEGSTAK